MTPVLEAAVGLNAPNKPVDVICVQDLLNNNLEFAGLSALLPVTGLANEALTQAISAFQIAHPGIKAKKPDGKVSVGGNTLKRLAQAYQREGGYRSTLPAGFNSNTFVAFNVETFTSLYALQFAPPGLGAAAKLGLVSVVNGLIADTDVTDLRWAAYMLATVKHECANTWLPIEEWGKGAGKDYGKAVAVVVDKKTTLHNIYFGRGYVQLTWDHRYQAMDTALGLSGEGSLYLHPELALVPATAYQIMSYGMRNGTFTSKQLSDYIEGAKVDYVNARRIINGTDKAQTIAAFARNIEFLLRFSNGVPIVR